MIECCVVQSVSSAVYSGENQMWLPAVVTSSLPSQLPYQLRQFSTCSRLRDIDQAAKYIGAGAATVGVAGSGQFTLRFTKFHCLVVAITSRIF